MGKINCKILICACIVVSLFLIPYSNAFAQSNSNQHIALGIIGKDIKGVDSVGAVYVFDEKGNFVRTITNPELIHGQFGQFITYKDNKLAIAAPWKYDSNNKPEGGVYVYDGTTGSLLFTIKNPEPNEYAGFGTSVAFIGNNIAVGFDSQTVSGVPFAGAVYLFNGNSGKLVQTINSPLPTAYSLFGVSIASVGNNLVVGAPGEVVNGVEMAGAVYIFDSTGKQIKKIENPEPSERAQFGNFLASSESKLLIGAPSLEVDGDYGAGGAYLYDGTTGTLIHTIHNPEPSENGNFGMALAFSGNNLVVGAPGNGLLDSGKVYIFDGKTGSEIKSIDNPQKIKAHDHPWGNQFGQTVFSLGDKILVGDPGKVLDEKQDVGAVYLIDSKSGSIIQTIDNPQHVKNDLFGYNVAFVGKMEPTQDLDSIYDVDDNNDAQLQDDSALEYQEDEPKNEESSTEITSKNPETIQWLDANYTLGGHGIVKIIDPDMNRNPELVDIFAISIWSDTDKKGIKLDMVETNRATGEFWGDTLFTNTESSIQVLKVSKGDTVTALYQKPNADMTSKHGVTAVIEINDVDNISKQVDESVPSPNYQIENGIVAEKVLCKEGLELIIKLSDNSPACVKPETKSKLIERGWATG